MPSIRQIPDNKRRSRTGCLPCRKRRRKCDEQKPECGSCTSRNVGCVYPRPTFVFEGQGGKSRTFESDVASVASDSPDGYPRIRGSPGARSGRVEHLVDFTVQQPGLGAPEQSPLLSSYAPASHSSPISYAAPSTEAPVGGRLDTQTINSSARSSSRAEAGLLSSFIQDIVPWIVSTCPGSTFANSVIGLAECQPAVRSAMIALVRARNKVICDADGTKVLEEHEGDYLDTVEREPGHVDDILAVNVAKSLLSVARLFGSRPTYWGKLGGNYLPAEEGSAEPLRYLLQMQGKIELAFCILTDEPPSTSLVSYLEQSVSAPNSAIRTAYLACLSLLAQCLHLTYHGIAQLTAVSAEHSQGSSSTRTSAIDGAAEGGLSWHSLWARCLHWYQARPLEMEPIFGLSSGEVLVENSASFPIEIYSTPIALQANMAIHLSFIILIAHKPRLLKLPRSEIRLGSDSWHAQKIAGMAVWNHFKEQFDPLFVAALLSAAEKMTHESQQIALLASFRDIEGKMGIVLDDQIERLENIWRTSRHDQR